MHVQVTSRYDVLFIEGGVTQHRQKVRPDLVAERSGSTLERAQRVLLDEVLCTQLRGGTLRPWGRFSSPHSDLFMQTPPADQLVPM